MGSSTFLSDGNGLPYQFLLYLTFGESMAEQKAGGFGNRYKFNGKEQDALSGLYYYGARFYDPVIGNWLSVDPEAEKFLDWSTYNFTLNNPIVFVDPNGESPIRGAVAAYRYAKKVYKIYEKLKKRGEQLTPKHLKDAGIEELADMAGDFITVFEGSSSGWDRAKAAVDLILGSDFNNKGAKAAEKAMDEVKDGVKGVYETSTKKGRHYAGKGTKGRMNQSAKDKSDPKNDDPNESKSFYPSKSDNDAKEEEAIMIWKSKIEYKKDNQNKIHTGRTRVNNEFGCGKFDKKKDIGA
jgi:RHS repeat-associated protein